MELTRESVLKAIAENDTVAVSALIKLYARQTADEQASQATGHDNGVGFNGTDAPFLSSLAEQAIARRADRKAGRIPSHYTDLSPRQIAALRKAITKYGRQLLEIAQETQAAKAARLDGAPIAPPQSAVSVNYNPLNLPNAIVEIPGGYRFKTAREYYAEGIRLSLPVQGLNGLDRSVTEPLSEFEELVGVGA